MRSVRELVDGYLSRRLSRRGFAKEMAAWGFSVAGVASILDSLAPLAAPAEAAEGGATPTIRGTGGELLAAQLAAAGVRFVFNCNGSGSAPLFDALVDRPEIHVIAVPQEGQMIAVAQGYGLASGLVPFTMSDSAGFPNTLNNMYNAWRDRSPLVVASQREATGLVGGRDTPQDWDEFLSPASTFSRWRWSVDHAARIPELTRRAFKIASTPPGGPVALAFPDDVLAAADVEARVFAHERLTTTPPVTPSPSLVEEAARLLVDAQRPLCLVGPEVTRWGATREVVALAERLAVPVAQGERLFDDFPTDHALFIGDCRGPSPYPAGADVVLSLGSRLPHDVGFVPDGARVVHVSIDPDAIGRVVPADVGVIGDVKATAANLLAAIDAVATGSRLDRLRDVRVIGVRAFAESLRAKRAALVHERWNQRPLAAERVSAELVSALDKDAAIVPELSQYGGPDFTENVALTQFPFGPDGMRHIGKTTGGALGWGVGAALGVKLALPDRQVVALQGDGGFLFGQAETLWTMARYEVPVLVVVYDNRSYNGPRDAIFRRGGRQAEAGKDMTCWLGDPAVDFAKVAAGFGVKGEVVEGPDQLRAAIQRGLRALRDGRPYLIDAVVARTGAGAASTWYPAYSVAASRTRKPPA